MAEERTGEEASPWFRLARQRHSGWRSNSGCIQSLETLGIGCGGEPTHWLSRLAKVLV